MDLGPNKKLIAKMLRSLGPGGNLNERRTVYGKLEKAMQRDGINWSDIGNAFEQAGEGRYTESEMQEYAQAMRAEGVEAGIKIGQARASSGSGNGNGHLTLPKPVEMAEYCHGRLNRMKDAKQRDFVTDMLLITRRGSGLSPRRLGYLASIYIQTGGKV